MSYEKLKISVAVLLVLFIFIIGNIFAFGYLQKVYDDNQVKNKPQNTQTDLNAIVLDTKKDRNEVTPSPKTIKKEEPKNAPSSERTTQTTASHTTQRTVKHHRRTRAS